MLARAHAGRYSQLEVNRGLPARYLAKYFHKTGLEWQIDDDIRGAVEFRCINLVGTWPALPLMDAVFLRNVMIYFDERARRSVLGNIRRQLRHDGYLMVGRVEAAAVTAPAFRSVTIGEARCFRPVER